MNTIRRYGAPVLLSLLSASYIAQAQIVNPSQPATGVPLPGTGISVAGQTVSVNYGVANSPFTGNMSVGGTLGVTGATTLGPTSATTLSASSTVSGVGFNAFMASPPPVGSTAANSGAFTTLTNSGTLTSTGAAILNGTVSGTGIDAYIAGHAVVQSVANITALRALSCVSGSLYQSRGWAALADGGAALYVCNGGDTTTTDDGCKFIAAANTFRFYLVAYNQVNVQQCGVIPSQTSTVQTTQLNAALLDYPTAYAPRGQYTFSGTITINPANTLVGDGVGNVGTAGTHFTYTGAGIFLSASFAGGQIRAPYYIDKIWFDGGTASTQTGLFGSQAHDYRITNSAFDNFGTGMQLFASWLGRVENVAMNADGIGLYCQGDCHRVEVVSTSIIGFTSIGLKIDNVGAFDSFGTKAFSLDSVDIEYGNGTAVAMNTDDVITIKDSYIGEGLTLAPVFTITAGRINCIGGLYSYGQSASFANPLVSFPGANPTSDERALNITKALVNVLANGSPVNSGMVLNGGPTSKLYLNDVQFEGLPNWNGTAVTMTGDSLGYLPGMNALTTPIAFGMTSGVTGTATATGVPTVATNSITLTATNTVVDGSNTFLVQPLVANKLLPTGAVCIIVVYKSNSAYSIILDSGGAFGAAPTVIASNALANTSGVVGTGIVCNQNPLAASYTQYRIFQTNQTNGNTITVYENYIYDGRQAGTIGTLFSMKNLYKPLN